MTDHHDHRTAEELALARHLYAKIAATAASLMTQDIPPRTVATAFLGAGTGAALDAFGPGQTVDWLRDLADAIEAENIDRLRN